jgi:hypothetical protein
MTQQSSEVGSAKVEQSAPAPKTRFQVLRHVGPILALVSGALFLAGFAFIGFYVAWTSGPHLPYMAVGWLTACAAFVTGCLVGLVVGIPRFVSSGALRHDLEAASRAGKGVAPADQTNGDKASSFTPSSNLAEISDWLTKLLLGAGLVELTRLGRPLASLVDTVARGLENISPAATPSGPSVVAAGAILATYVVLGFLDGYVVTTLWYGRHLQQLGYQ